MSKNRTIRYSDSLEELIEMAVADGKITDKERSILLRYAMEEGIERDEFEMVLEDRLRDASVEATDNGEVMDTFGRRSIMSSEKLASLLIKDDSPQRRVNIIKDFPIPSTEEDLLEFIITMSSKAKNQGKVEKDGGNGFDEKRAYAAKYEEACLKAKTIFHGNARFEKLMQTSKLSFFDRNGHDRWIVRLLKYFIKAIFIIGGIIFSLFITLYTKDEGIQVIFLFVFLIFVVIGFSLLNKSLDNGNT